MSVGAVATAIIPELIGTYAAWRANEARNASKEEQKKKFESLLAQYKDLPLEEYQQLVEAVDFPKVDTYLNKMDKTGKKSQLGALAKLQQLSKTGYTAEDRLREEEARRAAEQYEQSQRSAVLAKMAQRGIGGSGQEIALNADAQQGAADRAYMAQLGQASKSSERALEALKSYEGAAGRMRTQDTNEALAHDKISQFNQKQKLAYKQYLQRLADRNSDLRRKRGQDILQTQIDFNSRVPPSDNADMYANVGAGVRNIAKGGLGKIDWSSSDTVTPPSGHEYGPMTYDEYISTQPFLTEQTEEEVNRIRSSPGASINL